MTKKARINESLLRRNDFTKRSFLEKKTALSLVQLADQNKDFALGGEAVENLLGTLIAEAPSDVVAQFTADEQANEAKQAGVLGEKERKELEKFFSPLYLM